MRATSNRWNKQIEYRAGLTKEATRAMVQGQTNLRLISAGFNHVRNYFFYNKLPYYVIRFYFNFDATL